MDDFTVRSKWRHGTMTDIIKHFVNVFIEAHSRLVENKGEKVY